MPFPVDGSSQRHRPSIERSERRGLGNENADQVASTGADARRLSAGGSAAGAHGGAPRPVGRRTGEERAVLLHGGGGGSPRRCGWRAWAKNAPPAPTCAVTYTRGVMLAHLLARFYSGDGSARGQRSCRDVDDDVPAHAGG